MIFAWRGRNYLRTAYLRCRIGAPVAPAEPGLSVDTVRGPAAEELTAAGYPDNGEGVVEVLRLADIEECHFEIRGSYGGNTTIHPLAKVDTAAALSTAPIPRGTLEFRPDLSPRRTASRTPPRKMRGAIGNSSLAFGVESSSGTLSFDAYVMVDWSSRSKPVIENDSIWIGWGEWIGTQFVAHAPENVSTRVEAAQWLKGLLLSLRSTGKRVLVGLDFAFGYPAGFAARLGLAPGRAAWKSIHSHFAANVVDSPSNCSNRDAFAEQCNKTIGAPGPFWGCHKGSATRFLTQRRVGVFQFPHYGLAEWRRTDLAAKQLVTTQSVWKLNCGVSVGGQTILGIKYLHELAASVNGRIWPFESWTGSETQGVLFAEIFPSLVRYPEWNAEYDSHRDCTQVISCIRRAAERDAARLLGTDLAAPSALDQTTRALVENEEGWILWA